MFDVRYTICATSDAAVLLCTSYTRSMHRITVWARPVNYNQSATAGSATVRCSVANAEARDCRFCTLNTPAKVQSGLPTRRTSADLAKYALSCAADQARMLWHLTRSFDVLGPPTMRSPSVHQTGCALSEAHLSCEQRIDVARQQASCGCLAVGYLLSTCIRPEAPSVLGNVS